jgi:hypothetical protein
LRLLHEIAQPEFGCIHPQALCQHIHAALDRKRRFGYPERAAIGDAARRLIREIRVKFRKRCRKVVRPGDDAEKAGRIFRRIGDRVERAVIGDRRYFERRDIPGVRRADLNPHVVVASKAAAG